MLWWKRVFYSLCGQLPVSTPMFSSSSTRLGLYAHLPHLHPCAFSTLFSSESLCCAAWTQRQSRLLTVRCHRIWCWLARFFRPWQQDKLYISHLCALEATRGVTVSWRGSKVNVQYMWDPQRGACWIILGLLSEKTRQLPPGAHHQRFCLKSWRNSPPKMMDVIYCTATVQSN